MKKAIHKHIGRRLKKSHESITKYLLKRDTIFSTLWVFIFIFGLGAIPLNLGVLNPVKLGLKDFDFNDMSYSKLGKSEKANFDPRVVIFNIGYADRATIAKMIDTVATFKPRVMALDAFFEGSRGEEQDGPLDSSFSKHQNLVVAYIANFKGKKADTIFRRGDYLKSAHNYGWANFFQDSVSTIRTFRPVLKDYKDSSFLSFPTLVTKLYDRAAGEKLEKKGDKNVIINYSRNIDPNKKPQYFVIEYEDLLNGMYDESIFRDKIILFGYVNLNPNDIEDKKYSPMNSKFAGKTVPDMNGIVVHANIISMALDRDYVKKVPLWLTVLIAIAVCWLHMSFFIRYYLEEHIWFHLAAKILQVLSAIFFVWLGIFLFDQYRLKVDLKLSIVVVVLAVDVIYFYEAFAVWMHKKYGFKTIFGHHGHGH
jgi:CHASE2 domain-containing sensor protein